jgi:hypothetical protein
MSRQTYSQIDLATEQLDDAISLFLKNRSFFSALVLANVADEILSKALSRHGQKNSLDWKYEIMKLFGHQTEAAFVYAPGILNFISLGSCDTSVTLDFEDAALWMIVRACHNHRLLGLPPASNMREFDNYFYSCAWATPRGYVRLSPIPSSRLPKSCRSARPHSHAT